MKEKESKSLKILKKGFKKNEIVIYAIAIMLVTAGYFNYTANIDNKYLETASGEIQEELNTNENTLNALENTEEKKNLDVASSTEENKNLDVASNKEKNKNLDVASNTEEMKNLDVASNTEENKTINITDNTKERKDLDTAGEIEKQDEEKEDEDIGDAKLVNSDATEDYFATSKLERDTNYADMISTYTSLIEDDSVSETQKTSAMKEITKINNNKNSINICENLLSTKGFKKSLVLVNDNSINVVVSKEDELTKEKVAQIQNIISREFKCEIENIHITEKNN